MLENEYFVKEIGINGISKQNIINFFSHIRNMLRKICIYSGRKVYWGCNIR